MGKLLLVGFILAGILLYFVLKESSAAEALAETELQNLPFRKKHILSPTEQRFYTVIKPLCDEKNYLICPKVCLKDLFKLTDDEDLGENNIWLWGKIRRMHVDFVICSADMQPIFGIEVVNSGHNKYQSEESERFKNEIFSQCDFALYKIPSAEEYSAEFVRSFIKTFESQ